MASRAKRAKQHCPSCIFLPLLSFILVLSDTISAMSKLSIFADLWQFMRVRKKWWLMPILIVIILFGLLLIFAQNSVLAPFIYTLI